MSDDNLKKLREEFDVEYDEFNKKVQVHLTKAYNELAKACKLADQYGFSFYSNVSQISQRYVPENGSKQKWKPLKDHYDEDEDYDESLSEALATGEYGDYGGWEHSAVC